MIITDKFVWAHFQKTGGSAIHSMFEVIKTDDIISDPQNRHLKHDTFHQRIKKGVQLPDVRIMNLRRLPDWINSFIWFNERCTNIKYSRDNYKNGMIRDREDGRPDKNLIWRDIDAYLASYMDRGMTHWLKTRRLNEDFIEVIGKYININREQEKEIMELVNIGKGHYDKKQEYYTSKEKRQMYIDCPFWAHVEEKVYGSIEY